LCFEFHRKIQRESKIMIETAQHQNLRFIGVSILEIEFTKNSVSLGRSY